MRDDGWWTNNDWSKKTPLKFGKVVVSNIFYFHPYLGENSNLTNIFQMGWNHQLVGFDLCFWLFSKYLPPRCLGHDFGGPGSNSWLTNIVDICFIISQDRYTCQMGALEGHKSIAGNVWWRRVQRYPMVKGKGQRLDAFTQRPPSVFWNRLWDQSEKWDFGSTPLNHQVKTPSGNAQWVLLPGIFGWVLQN